MELCWNTHEEGFIPKAMCVMYAIANRPQSDDPVCFVTLATLMQIADFSVLMTCASNISVSGLNELENFES